MERFDCLMPAAGGSTRMGAWKLLLPVDGSTVVERSVENALGFCERVVLVVGYRGAELEARFAGQSRVKVARNPNFEAGMFSSIRIGAALVESDRFFIALADMPFIAPAIFAMLATQAGAARPLYEGRKGHPVLLPYRLAAKIRSADDAATMREMLEGLPLAELPTDDASVVRDIDTPRDYADLSAPPAR